MSSCIRAKPCLEIRLTSPVSARIRVEAEWSGAVHATAVPAARTLDPRIECYSGGEAVAASIRPVPWSPGVSKARVRGLGALQEQPVAPPTGPLRKRRDRVRLVGG
ncbi:hypothetical protein NDU88_000904 [Pleurodeles waltl]|uniref:Uncharacterized protein n=1 Tax=Pleurodeles waltl TaxID=8319 RepID=A0AAV7M1J3_PLEWA|nr:hypothetical protein NDU88_000904 [Pleurodeles waltl]